MLPLLGMLSRNALLQAAASLLSTNLQYQHTNASGNTQQACNAQHPAALLPTPSRTCAPSTSAATSRRR